MKKLSVVLAAACAAALVMIGAAPAVAAGNSIDPGDSLYSLPCDSGVNDWQLFSVESSTGFSTPIGTGTGSAQEGLQACAGQPAWNPVTGQSYYVQFSYDSDADRGVSSLAVVDPGTGVSTTISEFFFLGIEFNPIYVTAIAIGPDGAAYAIGGGVLWSLDLATGQLFYIADTTVDYYAFASDLTSGKFYVTLDDELVNFDVTDGTISLAGAIGFPEARTINSLQFDEAGTAWIEANIQGPSELWSFELEALDAPVYSGDFTDDPYFTYAILTIPGEPIPGEPILPATGSALNATPVGVALGLAVLGAGLLVLRRRTAA